MILQVVDLDYNPMNVSKNDKKMEALFIIIILVVAQKVPVQKLSSRFGNYAEETDK